MKLSLDTEQLIKTERSLNLIGEFLRGLFFDQSEGEYGCYSTFKVNEGVVEYPDIPVLDNLPLVMKRYKLSHGNENGLFNVTNSIEMRYYWDGDGYLEFRLPDSAIISNNDCKKDYNWKLGVENF